MGTSNVLDKYLNFGLKRTKKTQLMIREKEVLKQATKTSSLGMLGALSPRDNSWKKNNVHF